MQPNGMMNHQNSRGNCAPYQLLMHDQLQKGQSCQGQCWHTLGGLCWLWMHQVFESHFLQLLAVQKPLTQSTRAKQQHPTAFHYRT